MKNTHTSRGIVLLCGLLLLAVLGTYSSFVSTPFVSAASDDIGTQPLPAQADYFLEIRGVEGESTERGHEGELEILSFSWGETNSGRKVVMQDFHFAKTVDKSSPKLMLAVANGKHFDEAVLTVRSIEDQRAYYVIKLTDVMVSSYSTSGDNGQTPTEQFSLNYQKIEFTYVPQEADGSLDSPVKAGWDLKKNKSI